jgi:hypothetical protein
VLYLCLRDNVLIKSLAIRVSDSFLSQVTIIFERFLSVESIRSIDLPLVLPKSFELRFLLEIDFRGEKNPYLA